MRPPSSNFIVMSLVIADNEIVECLRGKGAPRFATTKSVSCRRELLVSGTTTCAGRQVAQRRQLYLPLKSLSAIWRRRATFGCNPLHRFLR
jgi:hypothetical protein